MPTIRVAEARNTTVGRSDSPADVQWARAVAAVIVGAVLGCAMVRPAALLPGAATAMPAELRALVAFPCIVMCIVRGES